MSEELDGVLLEISMADTPRALRLAGESARTLPEAEKEIARWSYAYAREELRTELRTPGGDKPIS